jgi:hypothetical protein
VRGFFIRDQTPTLDQRLYLLKWADRIFRERDDKDVMTSLFKTFSINCHHPNPTGKTRERKDECNFHVSGIHSAVIGIGKVRVD